MTFFLPKTSRMRPAKMQLKNDGIKRNRFNLVTVLVSYESGTLKYSLLVSIGSVRVFTSL
jgi:hypothetical protein